MESQLAWWPGSRPRRGLFSTDRRTSHFHSRWPAILVAVGLPWSLSLVWKKHQKPFLGDPQGLRFRDWRAGDFSVWGGKLHAMHAAVDMLLPLAAVAFGLTALGMVFLISPG